MLKTKELVSESCAILQSAVDALSKWGSEWHITFEPTKSQAMTIGRKRPAWDVPPIIFNANEVKEQDEIVMLGLTADKHMTLAPQTKKLAVSARKRLGFFRRASRYLHGKDGLLYTRPSFGHALNAVPLLGWARPNQTSSGSIESRTRQHSSSVMRPKLWIQLNTDAESAL